MVATTKAPSAADAAVSLFSLFDALTLQGYCHVTLFEKKTPGARDALRAWAEAGGHEIRERVITPPGAPAIATLIVDVRHNVSDPALLGPHICVQGEVA